MAKTATETNPSLASACKFEASLRYVFGDHLTNLKCLSGIVESALVSHDETDGSSPAEGAPVTVIIEIST